MQTTYYRWSEVAKCGLRFSKAGCCESEARPISLIFNLQFQVQIGIVIV